MKNKEEIKEQINSDLEISIKRLKKVNRNIKKIGLVNVTEGHLIEEFNDIIKVITSGKEQFNYFYTKEIEKPPTPKVTV